MPYVGQTITEVFPTSISVDSATISGNTTIGGTLGVTGASTLSGTLGVTGVSTLSDNIVFGASGKGVHLGVTSATASNLVDDYEEGTFTPTLALSNATLASSGGTGRYTKIGRWVYIEGQVSRATASGASNGVVQLESLPFTSLNANSISIGGSGTMWIDEGGPSSGQGDTIALAYVNSNETKATPARVTSSGAETSSRYAIGSEFTSGRPMYFNFAYTTA